MDQLSHVLLLRRSSQWLGGGESRRATPLGRVGGGVEWGKRRAAGVGGVGEAARGAERQRRSSRSGDAWVGGSCVDIALSCSSYALCVVHFFTIETKSGVCRIERCDEQSIVECYNCNAPASINNIYLESRCRLVASLQSAGTAWSCLRVPFTEAQTSRETCPPGSDDVWVVAVFGNLRVSYIRSNCVSCVSKVDSNDRVIIWKWLLADGIATLIDISRYSFAV